jgi:hypothetical protein
MRSINNGQENKIKFWALAATIFLSLMISGVALVQTQEPTGTVSVII